MQAERDHLFTHVFPALEDELKKRRCHLEWVDLRLGVASAKLRDAEARELQVLRVCLSEVRRCRPFLIVLLGDRYGWVPPADRMQAATIEEGLIADVHGRSVTELEIRAGVLDNPEQQPRSFFYFRDPLPYRDMPDSVSVLYADIHDTAPGAADRAAKLSELKQEIERTLPSRVRHYSTGWDRSNQRVIGLGAWGQRVFDDLWSELRAVTPISKSEGEVSWQQAERNALEDYIEDRTYGFIGRDSILGRLENLALSTTEGNATWGILLTGVAGTGKSAIFGESCRRLQERMQGSANLVLLRHSAGASARSPYVQDMLRRWIEDLAAALPGSPALPENANQDRIEMEFRSLLERTAVEKRVIILIDALDQFESTTQARFLTWLPRTWPENVRLIATAIPGEASKALADRTGVELLPVPPLNEREARLIAEGICSRYHRSLEPEVLHALLARQGADGPAWGNTLWLTLAVEELNLLDADEFASMQTYSGAAAEQLRALMVDKIAALAPDITGLYRTSFDRAYALFGESLARAFLGLIALGRSGWRETDFHSLLPRLSGESWDPLRFAYLRRLFRGQLRQRGALHQWTFAHDQMRTAILQRLQAEAVAEPPIHAELANYLLSLSQGEPLRENEVMMHLLGSESWAQVTTFYSAPSLTGVQLEAATREFARTFDNAANQGRTATCEQIAGALLRALLTRHAGSELTLSRVNAWLTYMQSILLRKVLTQGARLEMAFDHLEKSEMDFAIRCRGRLGEHWRREGKLEEAWALLRPLAGPIRRRGFIQRVTGSVLGHIRHQTRRGTPGREQSEHGPLYELGYIEFLRGNLVAARRLFEHSSHLELASGYLISAWISSCLARNCKFIEELSSPSMISELKQGAPAAEAFRRALVKARRVFVKAAATDVVADRWIFNVSANLFEVAFSQKDLQAGRLQFDELMRNDWARRFDQTHLLVPHRARYEMLEKRWKTAVEIFRRYFHGVNMGPTNYQEALARSALDYGDALVHSGVPQDAIDIWRAAIILPGDAGNRPWQSLIRRRLAGDDP